MAAAMLCCVPMLRVMPVLRVMPMLLFAAALPLFWASPVMAQQTRAGVIINNQASASFDNADGSRATLSSNVISLRVDEVIEVAVTPNDAGDVALQPGTTAQILSFRITNNGNGEEAFLLTPNAAINGDDFDPVVTGVVIDNGDNIYDATSDALYAPGSNDPVLAAETAATVFVIISIPADTADSARAAVQLGATARTGSGAPGTVFAGAGTGGGDAVIGASTGSSAASSFVIINAATVNILKTAEIADPFGGAAIIPGAIVTYDLAVQVTGTGDVSNLIITDPTPDGTTYQPGSITLNDVPLTDSADADAAIFTNNQIAVSLGTVAGGSTQNISFQVIIN